MSTKTIAPGEQVTKDPSAVKTVNYDWNVDNLAPAVTIITSTWTITAISPSQTDAVLTKDSESILAGTRTTQVRLLAGTLGQLYEIANKIRTSETPYQDKEYSFRVLIEQQ